MPNPCITLRFVVRTLARLRHATKLGPQTLAYVLVKNRWGRPSQIEHLARFQQDRIFLTRWQDFVRRPLSAPRSKNSAQFVSKLNPFWRACADKIGSNASALRCSGSIH
jgi:hypothetical protein